MTMAKKLLIPNLLNPNLDTITCNIQQYSDIWYNVVHVTLLPTDIYIRKQILECFKFFIYLF